MFSESEFYCILVSPVIICGFMVLKTITYLMDSNRYLFNLKIVLECVLCIAKSE